MAQKDDETWHILGQNWSSISGHCQIVKISSQVSQNINGKDAFNFE